MELESMITSSGPQGKAADTIVTMFEALNQNLQSDVLERLKKTFQKQAPEAPPVKPPEHETMEEIVKRIYGSWQCDTGKTPEQEVGELRASRYFREKEPLFD